MTALKRRLEAIARDGHENIAARAKHGATSRQFGLSQSDTHSLVF
jgi:hypothetical protein